MSQGQIRVFATVDRGLVDHPPVCVFPWEIAILQEIYGNVEIHSIDDMASTKEASLVNKIKLRHAKQHAPSLREQFELMASTVPDEVDPLNSPETEYERMRLVYGAHPEVAAAAVEVAFGRFNEGRFTKAVEEAFAKAKGTKLDDGSDKAGKAVTPEKALDPKMVKEALTEWGVNFKPKEANVLLAEKYTIIKALKEDDTIDFDVNESIENLRTLFELLPEVAQ